MACRGDVEAGVRVPPVRFTIAPIATSEMLKQVYSFDEHSYDAGGGPVRGNIPFALFEQWWRACPTGFLCAFRSGKPFVVIGFFPVSDAWATAFLEYRTSERELRAADIKASDRRTWYFSGISSNLGRGRLGMQLPCVLGRALLTWSQINADAIGGDTITVLAEGATPTGTKLLRTVFAGDAVSRSDNDRRKPRFKATTDLAGVRRQLIESPLFLRCRALRDEAAAALRRDA